MSCRGSREAKAIAKLNTMAADARVAVATARSARASDITSRGTRTDTPSVIWMHGQTPLHLLRRGQHAAVSQPGEAAGTDRSKKTSDARSLAGTGTAHEAGIRRGIGQRQDRSRFLVDVSHSPAE